MFRRFAVRSPHRLKSLSTLPEDASGQVRILNGFNTQSLTKGIEIYRAF